MATVAGSLRNKVVVLDDIGNDDVKFVCCE